MLFLGRIAAWLLLIFGALRVGVGFFVAGIENAEDRAVAAARYLGSTTSGEAIDQGLMVALCGIVLGVLVRIGQAAAKASGNRR